MSLSKSSFSTAILDPDVKLTNSMKSYLSLLRLNLQDGVKSQNHRNSAIREFHQTPMILALDDVKLKMTNKQLYDEGSLMIVNSGYVVRMLGFSKRFCHLLRLQDQDMMCSSGERLNFGDKGKARRIYRHGFELAIEILSCILKLPGLELVGLFVAGLQIEIVI